MSGNRERTVREDHEKDNVGRCIGCVAVGAGRRVAVNDTGTI